MPDIRDFTFDYYLGYIVGDWVVGKKGRPRMNTSLVTRKIGDLVIRQRIPAGDGPHPILLLLHGWTGDENSMWLFTSLLSHKFMILSPRGIFPTPLGGFGWHAHGRRSWPSVVDFEPAIEALFTLISAQNFTTAELSEIHIIGFSQGAALMYALALEFPKKVGIFAGLSGFLPEGTEELIEKRPLIGKHVFVAHGRMDDLVPVNRARLTVDLLEKAGAKVIYCEENVGHKLSANCFRGMSEFFKDYAPGEGEFD